jgi:hypothetical protein
MGTYVQRQTDGLDHGTYQIIGAADTFATNDTDAVLMGRENGIPSDAFDSAWYRFTDVDIPQGSIITSAKLTFQATSASQPGSPSTDIFGFAEDDSARIANADPDDYLARSRTTASVSWAIEAWTPGSADHDTPELKDIVQEIIDRAGWQSGNALALTVEEATGAAGGSDFRRAMSVQASPTGAPQLTIIYDLITAELSGDIFGSKEEDIRAGGRSLIITLGNAIWNADIGSDNTQTTALLNGIDSASVEGTGWDAVVKAGLVYSDVTRNSDTVVTILFPAFPTYYISAPDTITVSVESTAIS